MCPCCGYRLRSKPRNSLFKRKFGITKKPQDQENEIKAAIPVRD
jgi:hypothetical protein